MTDYTITTNFGAKDSLPSGNAGKVIKGSEFTTEFTNIQSAVNSKANSAGDTFTGGVIFSDTVVANGIVTMNSNAIVSNDLIVDTNTLFADASQNKVGINNATPAQELDVVGNITASGTLMGAIKTALLNEIYPVGSLYISTSSTSPATLYGGTWTAINDARVLQTATGANVGSYLHENGRIISEANLPAHDHMIMRNELSSSTRVSTSSHTLANLRNIYGSGGLENANFEYDLGHATGGRANCGRTSDVGSGTAFNVQQASYGVYMWKRDTLA
jgi:hypothetical protein